MADKEPAKRIDLIFKISRSTYAAIRFEGVVTREGIEQLIALLDVQKEAYPSQDELDDE